MSVCYESGEFINIYQNLNGKLNFSLDKEVVRHFAGLGGISPTSGVLCLRHQHARLQALQFCLSWCGLCALSGWLDVAEVHGVSSTSPAAGCGAGAAHNTQGEAVLSILHRVLAAVLLLAVLAEKSTPPIAWEHGGIGLSPGGGQVEAPFGDTSLRMPQGSRSPAAGLTRQPVPVPVPLWGAL